MTSKFIINTVFILFEVQTKCFITLDETYFIFGFFVSGLCCFRNKDSTLCCTHNKFKLILFMGKCIFVQMSKKPNNKIKWRFSYVEKKYGDVEPANRIITKHVHRE